MILLHTASLFFIILSSLCSCRALVTMLFVWTVRGVIRHAICKAINFLINLLANAYIFSVLKYQHFFSDVRVNDIILILT